MATHKTQRRKQQLVKAGRQNRRTPLFVVARTKRRVRYNRMTRNWQQQGLKLDKQ